MREIFKLPYPSTLVGSSPLPSSYLVLTTFKRNHDKLSYYLKFSAIPLREHVKFLSRHTVFYRLYGKIKGNFLAGPSQAIVP